MKWYSLLMMYHLPYSHQISRLFIEKSNNARTPTESRPFTFRAVYCFNEMWLDCFNSINAQIFACQFYRSGVANIICFWPV